MELLSELLTSLEDSATNRPRLGFARFEEANFIDHARFDGAEFGDAGFGGAVFGGDARFGGAVFGGNAWFGGAEFIGDAGFGGVEFGGVARFDGAQFGSNAWFIKAKFVENAGFGQAEFDGVTWFNWVVFGGDARFGGVVFGGDASFSGARFGGDARFSGAEFGGNARFMESVFECASAVGPLACKGVLDLSEAVFGTAVTIEATTAALLCRRTRWASTAALRLRYALVDLSDAVVEYPVSIATRSRPFTVLRGDVRGLDLSDTVVEYPVDGAARSRSFNIFGRDLPEPGLTVARVRVISLRGVDAAHLVLTDVDLTDCRFAGTIHLDQLRLEGLYTLAAAPSGLRRRGMRPVRWTPRRTLADEHHWRATRFTDAGGWTLPPAGEEVLEPAALASVYRQLRKGFEDGKHEPGAADFYYGEMEMRRHADDIPLAERSLLTAYWALSGYGLRASRALGWLLLAMVTTVLMMMLWGLPKDDSTPQSTGTVNGRSITMTTDTPDPVNPDGAYRKRLSTERFEKSLRVVINSVVFRSSGQDLTTFGTYTEMVSRVTEPVLLGLSVLAVRGRVKR